MPVSEGKIRSLLLAVMIALWLARPVTALLGHPTLSEVTLSAWTFIGLFAAVAALRFAMRGTKVDVVIANPRFFDPYTLKQIDEAIAHIQCEFSVGSETGSGESGSCRWNAWSANGRV